MYRVGVFLFSFTIAFLFAQKPLIPSVGTPSVTQGKKPILLKGCVLVPGGTDLKKIKIEPGIHIDSADFPAGLEKALLPFLEKPLSEKLIVEIKKTIVDYYRENQGLYVAAVIPVQKLQNGVMVVQILEGSVDHIEYRGQKWFSKKVLAKALSVKVGDPLVETTFLNDVTWANRNPFRKTQLVLVPGEKPGETDVLFLTKDKFPLRVFAGADNTGYESNGEYRIYAGFDWGNAFFIGDLLTYQYSASPNFHNFQSHLATYSSFLPWQHLLTLFGTYGTVYPQISGIRIEGKSGQASLRYKVPFRPFYGALRNHLEWGFDWKYLTSNFFFVGDIDQASTSNQRITITEFLLSYKMQKNWPKNLLTLRLDMFFSPWKNWIFPYQTKIDYESQRARSDVRYAYFKALLSWNRFLKGGFTFFGQLRGQASQGILPTAEQFGLGGINTVRGYFEQQFVADNAVCCNLELFTPSFRGFKKGKDHFAFLAFTDYGYGYNYAFTQKELESQHLLGLGPGIVYEIGSYLKAKLDYGFQVLGIFGDNRFGRFHFSVNATY